MKASRIAHLVVVACLSFTWSAEARPHSTSVSRDPGGHTGKGVAAAKSKNYDTAIAEFTKAIEAQPKDAKNYKNRGLVYKLTGKLKAAETDFAKAMEL
jgi:Flp pilus assembly protein TadD